jgi:hypothetical protein
LIEIEIKPTHVGIIYGILATFGHYMVPTNPYKMVLATPKCTRHNKVKVKIIMERLPPFLTMQ